MKPPSSQLVLDLPLRTAMGRDDFLVTQANAAAVELIDQWPNWPSYGALLVGPAGSGKSHLAKVFQLRAEARMVFASDVSTELVPEFLQNGALIIEDLGQTPFDQVALFHALNFARQQNATILLTSRLRSSQIPASLTDLTSRLNALPSVTILPPDDELLRAVLVKHFTDRQLMIDEPIITFLLQRMPRSLQTARELAHAIDRKALVERAQISKLLASRVLREFTNLEPSEEDL